MKRDLILQLLGTAMATIDAAYRMLAEESADAPAGCTHPPEQRADESTMGHPRWRCATCGHVEEVKKADGDVRPE